MASEIKVDTISEKTSANGVTIDGVSLKDSKIATANSVDSDAYVDASIDNAHLADNAVDTAEIADNAVTLAKMDGLARGTLIYGDASGDPAALAVGGADEVLTHDGTDLAWAAASGFDVSSITGATALGAEPADTDEFVLSDAGVLKRVDYSYIKAANTPSFFAYLSADQALSDSTETKIEIDTEIYDTDSDYDNTTNYRFTPTTAGKYVIFGTVSIFQDDGSDLKIAQILWYKNGSKLYETHDNYTSNYLRGTSQSMSVVMDMNGSSDYVEMYAEIQIASGENNLRVESANRRTVFGAYKLIGV